jgi:hypothetical protein
MGGLFNTPGTLAILQVLNVAYQGDNFTTLSGDTGHITDLGTPVGTLSSFNFCRKYRLIPTDGNVEANWKKWLSYFDGANDVANTTRQSMVTALKDAKCSGIEFFAVPTASGTTSGFNVTTSQLNDQQHAGMYTLIITAFTPTMDQI